MPYIKKGLHDKAIADLNKAIELKPNYAVAFYNRGLVYKIKGRFERAISDYTEAIRRKPDYAFAYTNRGNVYSETGFYDKAIADKTKAITLLEGKGDKRSIAITYFSRGISYEKKGSYDRSIADLNKAIELDPEYARPYNHLAWLLATSADADHRNGKRAVELAERASVLDWNAANVDTLAAAYAETGRFEEAISTQFQAIALLKNEVDKNTKAKFEKHFERYRSHQPWRIRPPESSSDTARPAIALNGPAEQKPARAIGKEARRQEEPGKQELRRKIEALSGRYITAGGRSHWDIIFKGDRFEARRKSRGGIGEGHLLYDGAVVGTQIYGRGHFGLPSFCRQLPKPPLYGSVDLLQKSFKIFWRGYDLGEMIRNKRCVPITRQKIWTRDDRD